MIPTGHREDAEDMFEERGSCGFSFGNGCSSGSSESNLFGASPANLAGRLARLGTPARRVSGLSLPMLLRVMNYAELPLDELPAIAAAGARNGVIHDDG